MTPNEQVVANLVSRRKRLGMSQADIAEKMTALGCPSIYPQTIGRIELGLRKVSVNDLAALAGVLGFAPGDLLGPLPPCPTCQDAPPAGFTCQGCGTKGEPPSEAAA